MKNVPGAHLFVFVFSLCLLLSLPTRWIGLPALKRRAKLCCPSGANMKQLQTQVSPKEGRTWGTGRNCAYLGLFSKKQFLSTTASENLVCLHIFPG